MADKTGTAPASVEFCVGCRSTNKYTWVKGYAGEQGLRPRGGEEACPRVAWPVRDSVKGTIKLRHWRREGAGDGKCSRQRKLHMGKELAVLMEKKKKSGKKGKDTA